MRGDFRAKELADERPDTKCDEGEDGED